MKKSLGHWVPQTYLNRFAIDTLARRLKIFKYRKNGKIFPDNIRNVASKKSFYIFKDKNTKEESAGLENAFCELEGEYKKASDKLLQGKFNNFNNRDKIIMSEFIAYSYVRTPAFIDYVRILTFEKFKLDVPQLIKKEGALGELKRAGFKISEEEAQKIIDELPENLDNMKLEGDKWYFLTKALNQAPRLARMAYEKNWHILIANTNSAFITSDNPLIIWASRDFPIPQNAGFKYGTIVLTLSPKVSLMLRNCLLSDNVIGLTENQVDAINSSIMKNSDDCILSNIKSEKINTNYLFELKNRKGAVSVVKHKFVPYVFMQSKANFDKEIF